MSNKWSSDELPSKGGAGVRVTMEKLRTYATTGGYGPPGHREMAAIAGGVAAVTAVILLALRPPMIQQKAKDDFRRPRVSATALLIWAALAGVAAAALRWYGNHP